MISIIIIPLGKAISITADMHSSFIMSINTYVNPKPDTKKIQMSNLSGWYVNYVLKATHK